MENFITLLLFTLPGIVTYFLIQSFGITPVQKHQGTELISISAILCSPIIVIVVLIYNMVGFVIEKIGIYEVQFLFTMSDFKILTERLSFLLFYFVCSMLLSILIACSFAKYYQRLLNLINTIRKKNGYAAFSSSSTVWKETFNNNDMQLVKVGQFGSDDYVVGCINKVSRDFETKESMVIDSATWEIFYDKFKERLDIKEVFIAPNSAIKVEIFEDESVRELLEEWENEYGNTQKSQKTS